MYNSSNPSASGMSSGVGNFDLLSEMLAGTTGGGPGGGSGGNASGGNGGNGQQGGGGGGGNGAQQAQYNHQALLEQRLKLNQLQQLQLQNQIIQQQVSLLSLSWGGGRVRTIFIYPCFIA